MKASEEKIWTITDASKILEIDRTTLYARAYRTGVLKKHKLLLSDSDLEKLKGPKRQWGKNRLQK